MYDSNTQVLSSQLSQTSSTVFTQDTINSILALVSTPTDSTVKVDTVQLAPNTNIVTPAAGTEFLFVQTSDTSVSKVTVAADTPAIFFQGKGGVDAVIGVTAPLVATDAQAATAEGGKSAAVADPNAIVRVVVGTAGADTITIADGKATEIIAGDKDVIKAGSGHTLVVAAQGSSTVVGGADTVVQVKGAEKDFTIAVDNGHVKVTNATTHVSVDMTGVHYVQLDNKEALIFADNAKQAAVAELYQAVFQRTAESSGLEFWFNQADKGVSLKAIAQGFMASSEYALGNTTDAQFVDALYHGVMGRSGETAGTAFWTNALAHGASRADVIVAFAEAAANSTTEATIVGSVTIVPHTV